MKKNRLTAYMLLLVVSAIWGIASPIIKYTLDYFPPFIFLSYRFLISGILSLAWILMHRKESTLKGKDWNIVILYSLLSFPLTLSILFFGIERTTSMSASILSTTGPLFIIALGAVILKDHITKQEIIGTGVALAATLYIVLSSGNAGTTAGQPSTSMTGNALIVLAFILDAVASIIAKVISKRNISLITVSHISFVIAFVSILPLSFMNHSWAEHVQSFANAPFTAHLGVFYMAVLSGSAAYLLRNIAVTMIEVSESAIFNYLHPLWAFPVSMIWLGEQLTTTFVIGSLGIVSGVVISEYHRRKKKVAKSASGHKKRASRAAIASR